MNQQKSLGPTTCLQFVVIVFLLLLLSACDDEVNPFIGTELPYTVWGTINPVADTQAVRIFLIDDILQLVSPDPLDATVSIIDVKNNARHILQDSVIQLFSGDYRHIYWAHIDIDYLETYRLEVERSDGLLTKSAEIRVPGPISMHVIPANVNAITDLIQPIRIEGNPPSTPRIDVIYNSFTINRDGTRLAENPVTLSYASKTRVIRDTLRLEIDVRDDFAVVREDFNTKQLAGLICVDDIEVRIHVGNAEWKSPTGVFDPNFLVEPGTFSNIDNGFGFFGAGYIETFTFSPLGVLLVRAGFSDCGPSN